MSENRSERHICFEELEPGAVPDAGHLDSCPQCRRRAEAYRLLRFQIRHVPRLQPSPFFASRVVAHLSRSGPSPVLFLMQRVARRLTPVFLVLIAGVSFLVYQALEVESGPSPYSEILVGEMAQQEVTLEHVVDLLSQLPEEGGPQR